MSAHLIVKLGAIGDVVMALPAVKYFKESVGGEIHWMCGRPVVPLLELFPFIDRVIAVDDRALLGSETSHKIREMIRLWKLLAGAHYETCAVLYYDWRYTLLTSSAFARRRIRLSRTDRSRKLMEGRYHGDEYARILLGEDGLRPARLPPLRISGKLPASPLARTGTKRIALVPGGARNLIRDDPLRRWPLSHYVQLSAALSSRGYEVILIGGVDDHWVSASFAGLEVTNLIGRLELTELLSVFNTCDLVISHDTGPLHLAALSSAAVLALFGPVNPHGKIPNRPDIRHIWGGEDLACRPCYDGVAFPLCRDNRCMKDISPDLVLDVADQMLKAAGDRLLSAAQIVQARPLQTPRAATDKRSSYSPQPEGQRVEKQL